MARRRRTRRKTKRKRKKRRRPWKHLRPQPTTNLKLQSSIRKGERGFSALSFLFFRGIFLLFRARRVRYKFLLWKRSSSAISRRIRRSAPHSSSNQKSCEIRRPAANSR